ncbi:MAG TPA: TlpA disulfide reductase family protein [Bryobacteraceae bacterium]|jgi:thiol-disulfide isomerase/thioredoxin|nr:TlpA disulfide reductase family protein [Bryobacteraceae bacterium]
MKLLTSFVALGLVSAYVFAQSNMVRKAPELAFTLPGQGDKLLSQYRGKVVALEFILTTCPHCQAASRVMTKFQQQYGPRGFQALDLAINALDDGRTPQQAALLTESFANNFQVGFPVGYIGRDPMMSFMGFSVMDRMVVPQLVLIDRKGVIRYQTPASDANDDYGKLMREDAIQQHIEELLAQPDSASTTAHHRAAVRKSS